jgi:hypothetical protein
MLVRGIEVTWTTAKGFRKIREHACAMMENVPPSRTLINTFFLNGHIVFWMSFGGGLKWNAQISVSPTEKVARTC